MRKITPLVGFLALSLFTLLSVRMTTLVQADPPENKVVWCHCEPNGNCQDLNLPIQALTNAGHVNASGNILHAGDHAGVCPTPIIPTITPISVCTICPPITIQPCNPTSCPQNTPTTVPEHTPTLSPSPTTPQVTPENTPTVSPIDTPVPTISLVPTNQPSPNPTQTPANTPTLGPTIQPTPTNTPAPTSIPHDGGSSGGSNNPGPQVCTDTKPGTPSGLAATWISSSQVRLTWTHVAGPHTSYVLAYGPSVGNYPWGSPNVGNDNQYIVNSLNPGTPICFVIQAQNGCMTGDRSNTVCVGTGTGSNGNAQVLGASTNYNPLVAGIKESYGGAVLGVSTELMGTAEVTYSTDKLPSGNTLDSSHTIQIPSLGLSESIYLPQKIGDQYTVGSHEVLFDRMNGNNVYYGHNATDVFGKLYQLTKGNKIIISQNGTTASYEVSELLFVHKSQVDALNSQSNQIVLTTCSYTQPDYRIVIKATLIK